MALHVNSLKNKLDGNELDLSLNQLSEVPVKELAAIPKATHLDLSCNKIKTLPPQFCSLTHLVKLDLSKNELVELPKNIGNLNKLQYLDLYGNQLTTLPVSFARLKSLKWLDLKNNPLNPELKSVAGDCLDQKQCQQCAKKVVEFMQTIESNLEREKQKRLKEEREKEALRKAEEERELQRQKQLKKAAREKKKQEQKLLQEELRRQKEKEALVTNSNSLKETVSPEKRAVKESRSCWKLIGSAFLTILVLGAMVTSAVLAYHVYTGHKLESQSDVKDAFREGWRTAEQEAKVLWRKIHPHVVGALNYGRECALFSYKLLSTNARKGVDAVMVWLNSFNAAAK